MNPLGRHWQIETLGLVQTDINRLLQTDIGERNGGNQFRKTPIEPIRQTLVKGNFGFNPDRYQVIPSDRYSGRKALGITSGRHRLNPVDRHWRKKIGFGPDRHQQVPPERHWQKRNGGNQSKQTLIKPIR